MLTKKTICPYDCPTSCGLLAMVDGQRILGVKGDPEDPVTGGLICRKMQHYERSIHSSERITTPLMRTGKKGEGAFRPAPWDEAVQAITDQWKKTIREHGPQTILPYYYSGVMSLIQRDSSDALFNRMGACSLVKTLCSSAKSAGYAAVMGKTGCLDPRELRQSDLYVVWGSNMQATRLQGMADMVRARRTGKRVVLIECCATDMAPYSDQVVLIRPGTDGALALALMHVLSEEGLDDADFLRREAEGYDEFRQSLSQYTPAWAEDITGVPSEIIVALAREFGRAKAPAIILGSGNSRYGNGGMTTRLVTLLSAWTGAWTRPGGGLCGCPPGGGPYVDTDRISRPDLRPDSRPENIRRVNINMLASALLGTDAQDPIKCLHVYACNPVGSVCHQQGIIKGLKRPDLFTVVHERFMTDTARYADVILPATFSVEHSDCHSAYGYCSFGTARKLIDAPGQCKSNWEIFCMLAQAMGYDDEHFRKTEDELLDELLDHPQQGLTSLSDDQRQLLRTGGVVSTPYADHTAWKTPTGKMRIVNPDLDEPMPRYTEAHGGTYPLKLIAVPSKETLNSIFLERNDLVDKRGPMTLDMHPHDATKRGIVDGDTVCAFNELGEVLFTARLTELVVQGAVAAAGVFTRELAKGGNLVNTLHHERLSDIGAATTLNDNTVDVRRA